MVDIVEIALDKTTDFADFEKLACEVLREEGYSNIKPLGGTVDKGRDAVAERFYVNEGRRSAVVFQITTQETIEAKLKSVIRRLEEAGITYSQLVIVTSRSLSTDRQDSLMRIAREMDVPLALYERKTLVNRLSNFQNGIFHRHFPDIERQVKILLAGSSDADMHPEAVVRCALFFTGTNESDRARNAMLDELIFALLLHGKGEAREPANLVALHKELLPNAQPLEVAQIRASLDRRVSVGLVEPATGGAYLPTEAGLGRALVSTVNWDQRSAILAADVADCVEHAIGDELDQGTRGLIERNTCDALGVMFRLMGLEVASQLLGQKEARQQQYGGHEAVIQAARRELPRQLAEVVVAAFAEILANPNAEQAEALTAYAYGYIGASVIEVDPGVREFQTTRLSKKVFLLDTDFLIDCLVAEGPTFDASQAIVRQLVDSGTLVIVPNACLSEAARHAGFAFRTVNYFGSRIFGLTRVQALDRIQNAFAKGWYLRCLVEPVPFDKYIANYYEPTVPVDFMRRVIEAVLPRGVEIGDVASILGIKVDPTIVAALTPPLYDLHKASRKSQYRTDEEMRDLAQTDANLYSAAVTFESSAGTVRQGKALGGSCYLITSALRFIKAVELGLGHPDEVSARPGAIAALLQLVGRASLKPKEFVALFDNPLLQHVTMQCKEDVEKLLDAGLSTRGRSLARLVFDLDTVLHERIAELATNERRAEETLAEKDDADVYMSYVDLVREAERRNYSSLPTTQKMLDEIRLLRGERDGLAREVEELTGRMKEVEEAIGVFGRRKQRYLKRMAEGSRAPRDR